MSRVRASAIAQGERALDAQRRHVSPGRATTGGVALAAVMLASLACGQSALSPALSTTTTTTSAPDPGTAPPGGSALSLDASRWTEGLVPTFITFRNDANGALYFDMPGVGQSVNYAFAASPASTVAGTVHLTFRVDAVSGQPTFQGAPEAGNTCAAPPSVRPFLFTNHNDWSGEFSRWWATSDVIVLTPGAFSIDVPLTPDRWTSVYGRSGLDAPTQFAHALTTVSSLGVSFGAGCFYGHGVFVAGGTARWVLSEYSVR
jgi:hypothetical protein